MKKTHLLTESRSHQRAPDVDSLLYGSSIRERWIDFHQIKRHQAPGFVNRFADVMPLSESQPASDRGAGRRGNGRVHGVDIEAEMDGTLSVRALIILVQPLHSQLDDLPDAATVNFVHREGFDTMFLEDGLLTAVNIAQADVDQARGG